jgi:hypothetical protein
MNFTRTLLTLALLATLPATLVAQRTAEFRWEGAIEAGKTLEIRGLNGEIDAMPATGSTVELVAVRHAEKSDPNEVEIVVVEHAGGVRICAAYPLREGGVSGACDEDRGDYDKKLKKNDIAVDFTVRVPAGVEFVGNTVNGAIEANSLRGDVRVHTVNGAVSASGTGTVEAHTVNGAIDVSMGQGTWNGTLSLHTVNGSINVGLPADVNASVVAQTVNGGLNSDFPLAVAAGKRWGPRRIEGSIGTGGGRLEMQTVNGSIELARN